MPIVSKALAIAPETDSFADLHHADGFRADEFGVDGLIAHIANLLLGHQYFGERAHSKGQPVSNPEAAEIAKCDGSCTISGCLGRHIARDIRRLAEDGTVAVIP